MLDGYILRKTNYHPTIRTFVGNYDYSGMWEEKKKKPVGINSVYPRVLALAYRVFCCWLFCWGRLPWFNECPGRCMESKQLLRIRYCSKCSTHGLLITSTLRLLLQRPCAVVVFANVGFPQSTTAMRNV